MNSEHTRDKLMRLSWREIDANGRTPHWQRLRRAINYLDRRIVRDCDHDHCRHGVCRYCGHELDAPDYEYLRD